LQDKGGNLWFLSGNSNGIYRYDGISFTNFTEKDGLSSNKVWCIFEDNMGMLWVGTADGINCYDGKKFTVIPISKITGNLTYTKPKLNSFGMPYPMDNSILSILQDRTGIYWFGTPNGIYCYDGKAFTPFYFNNSLGMKPGYMNNEFMMEDRDGNIWIGGRGMAGIFCFDGKTLNNFKPDSNAWLYPLLQDHSGIIWFGSVSDRVYQYDGTMFTNFTGVKFAGGVNSLEQDKVGNLWFATQSGGLTFYDGKSFINFTEKDGVSSNSGWSIIEDKRGNLWFLTKNGLSRYDGKTFSNFSQ
jgi:ligand-binding sensor domain-containing protein